jgi:hypothetical protein
VVDLGFVVVKVLGRRAVGLDPCRSTPEGRRRIGEGLGGDVLEGPGIAKAHPDRLTGRLVVVVADRCDR